MTSLEQNKAIVTTFVEALGRGDAQAVKNLCAPDIQALCTGTSVLSGTRGLAEIVAATGMLGQFTRNGIRFEILQITAEDDRVACEMKGHSELVNGMRYDNEYHMLFTLRDGQVHRMKEYLDTKLTDATLGALFAQQQG